VTSRPGLQAKHFDAFAPRLRDQSIENAASYSPTSRSLFNPHSFNFGPVAVQNKSARGKGFPFCVTGHKEAHLRPSKGVERKMVIAFRRIEARREGFPVAQKLNDIGLSWVFQPDA
jgi:hypothetical protein